MHEFSKQTKAASDGMPLGRATCSCGWKGDVFYRETNSQYIGAAFARHVMISAEPGIHSTATRLSDDVEVPIIAEVIDCAGDKWIAFTLPKDAREKDVDPYRKGAVYMGETFGFEMWNWDVYRGWFRRSFAGR